jgi:hypothetical protein
MTRLMIKLGNSVSTAELFRDRAPLTAQALLDALPIVDRTIQVRWSGNAWRTEGNYELRPEGSPVENVAGQLSAGDIIYFPGWRAHNIKVGIAYGPAQWLNPFMVPVEVCHLGRIVDGLDDFVKVSQRIIFDGPVPVVIARAELLTATIKCTSSAKCRAGTAIFRASGLAA